MKKDETATKGTQIVKIGAEGYGVTIFGRKQDDEWIFFQEGSSMGMDANDDIEWHHWQNSHKRLEDALPGRWWRLYPIYIHPDFLDWFRENYANAANKETRKKPTSWNADHWMRILHKDKED